jgi:hypothetical protein
MPEMEKQEYKFPDEVDELEKEAQAAEDKANAVEEKEIDIEVVDDTPPQDRNRKPAEPPEEVTEDELESYDAKVQSRIKKFTRGYHDERRAKEAALREREEAIRAAQAILEENKRLQQQLEEGSKVYIEQGKSAAQLELDSAKRAFKEAYEAGDSEALADAQFRISQATLKMDKAESLRPIQAVEREIQLPQTEPVEQKLDSRTAEWLEDNPWYGDDDEMSATALGLHKKLEKEFGKSYIGSEAYFKRIDDTMRKRYPEYFGSEEQAVQTPVEEEKPQTRAKPASNVVAPATRSVAPKKVKLTTTQIAIAKKLGVPLDLYAKKVAEQINGGQ